MIKKFLIYFMVLFSIISVSAKTVEANENIIIKSSYLIQGDSNSYLIPIEIENNTGIMGFKINVSYGDGVVINSISRGTVTEKGTFSDNHKKNSEEHFFDVIWNYSKEIKQNGEIFIIGLSVDESYKEDIKLNISYSAPDTFNEKYENVTLECGEIVIKEKDAEEPDENTEESFISDAIVDNKAGIISNEIDNVEFVAVVEEILNKNNYDGIEKIPNENVSVFVEEIVKQIDSEKVKNIFLQTNDEEKYKIIKKIYESQIEEKSHKVTTKANEKKDNKNALYAEENNKVSNALPIAVVIVCLILCVLIIIRIEGNKNETK